jgi:hypothetical protein
LCKMRLRPRTRLALQCLRSSQLRIFGAAAHSMLMASVLPRQVKVQRICNRQERSPQNGV